MRVLNHQQHGRLAREQVELRLQRLKQTPLALGRRQSGNGVRLAGEPEQLGEVRQVRVRIGHRPGQKGAQPG